MRASFDELLTPDSVEITVDTENAADKTSADARTTPNTFFNLIPPLIL